MIEDGTGIRHHAKAFGDVGTVIPPIILYRKAHVNVHQYTPMRIETERFGSGDNSFVAPIDF